MYTMHRDREPARVWWATWSKTAKENVNEQIGVGGGYRHFALSGGLFDPRVGLRGVFARPSSI